MKSQVSCTTSTANALTKHSLRFRIKNQLRRIIKTSSNFTIEKKQETEFRIRNLLAKSKYKSCLNPKELYRMEEKRFKNGCG